MSLKGQSFHLSLIRPQVESGFVIYIPGVMSSLTRCYAASLPFEVRNEQVLNISGENVYLPTKSQVMSEWTCTLYESDLMDMVNALDKLKKSEVVDVQGVISSYGLHDVYVMTTNCVGAPTYGKVLRYAWIKSVEPINLSADAPNKAVSYKVTFRYSMCDSLLDTVLGSLGISK